MKQILALFGVLLIFLPAAMAGDNIVQSIGVTLPPTPVAVTQIASNDYIVGTTLPVTTDIDSIVQSINYGGTSTGSSVFQENSNTIDLSNIDDLNGVIIDQSITQTADAATDVNQYAYNEIDSTVPLELDNGALVSQTIDQLASAGDTVDQEAYNYIDDTISVGDDVGITQSISQAAVADGDITQGTDGNNGGANEISNYIAGTIGTDIVTDPADGNGIDQSIEQIANSLDGAVYQTSGADNGVGYAGTNLIGAVIGSDNVIDQDIFQAASAQGDIGQEIPTAFEDGNDIASITGDGNAVDQEAAQIAVSNTGDVDQEAGDSASSHNANSIDSAVVGDGNTISQDLLQAALSNGVAFPYIDQDSYANWIGSATGDDNAIDQGIAQIAVAAAGEVYQDSDDANTIDGGLVGDDNVVDQVVLQAALAAYVEQDAWNANDIDVAVTGDYTVIDQDIEQIAVSDHGDIYQDAATGNNLPVVTGDAVDLSQDIEQYAATGGYLHQDAGSYIDEVDSAIGIIGLSYVTPEIDQDITQVGVANDLEQYSLNDANYVDTADDVIVDQDIYDVAQWGNSLDRDAVNSVEVASADDATVYQAVNTVNVGTDLLGNAVSDQTNEIVELVANDLTATQDNNAGIFGDFANFAYNPQNIIT